MNSDEFRNNISIPFNLPKHGSSDIKVIGIGGCGGNAVNYMLKNGIDGADLIICNTDKQALNSSPVRNKIQLGVSLTEGRGSGGDPEIGRKSVEESISEIKKVLETKTKMLFLTSGMGGGTGTGASPIIAKLAREMNILTVAVITLPFKREGKLRSKIARIGLEEIRKNVDSLIIINNEKLNKVYGDLSIVEAYEKSDEVLCKGVKSVVEIVSRNLKVNVDLNDVTSVLKDSGTAVMGIGIASGENRVEEAINTALDFPLLEYKSILGAKKILLKIVWENDAPTSKEIDYISAHIQNEAGGDAYICEGVGTVEGMGENIQITIIATGFGIGLQDKHLGFDVDSTSFFHRGDDAISLSQEAHILKINKTKINHIKSFNKRMSNDEIKKLEDEPAYKRLERDNYNFFRKDTK
ncbi:cell division protein FtsZ [Ichthyobacterium seriolicida]|uniref:Cell division protein FtsZ n=1 Tax=Ichthyobacterium seriolicida TaxID=242600 RepID=A0A1J1DZC6_9FLAO|nr:cell division protein FtsZ [Ichthyobacterium seriolicida]BAV95249.1 cell division protein FtsZ [Ichthyobacterium seriolicida]